MPRPRKGDIVDRLWASDAASALTNEAAREIEKLRAQLAAANAQVVELMRSNKEPASDR